MVIATSRQTGGDRRATQGRCDKEHRSRERWRHERARTRRRGRGPKRQASTSRTTSVAQGELKSVVKPAEPGLGYGTRRPAPLAGGADSPARLHAHHSGFKIQNGNGPRRRMDGTGHERIREKRDCGVWFGGVLLFGYFDCGGGGGGFAERVVRSVCGPVIGRLAFAAEGGQSAEQGQGGGAGGGDEAEVHVVEADIEGRAVVGDGHGGAGEGDGGDLPGVE